MRLRSFVILLPLAVFTCQHSSAFAQSKSDLKVEQSNQDTARLEKIDASANVSNVMSDNSGVMAPVTRAYSSRTATKFKDRRDAKEDIFYSNGAMYVDENAGTTTMYVEGTVMFDNSAEIVQKGETALTGDFVSLKGETATSPLKQLFVEKDAENNNVHVGSVTFMGKWNKQSIIREKAEPANQYDWPEDEKKALQGMVLNFPTIKVRKDGIKSMGDIPTVTTYNDTELISPLNKPKFDFRTMGFVEAASNVAISVENLDIQEGNRFSAEMKTEGLATINPTLLGGTPDNTYANEFYKLNSAYLDVKKLTDGNGSDGYSEVNMKLYRASTPTSEDYPIDNAQDDLTVQWTNTYGVTVKSEQINPTATRATFLRGITSPFQDQLRADYMFYHLLTEPSASNVAGDDGKPIAPPTTKLHPGKGYFFAMDASREKFENIQDNWHADGGNKNHPEPWVLRAREGYNFSRLLREIVYESEYYKDNFDFPDSRFGEAFDNYNLFTTMPDRATEANYETQRFITDDVVVSVEGTVEGAKNGGGLNFLANPFMTPITLKDLLGPAADKGLTETPFAVGNTGAYAVGLLFDPSKLASVPAGAPILRSKYWIVSSGLVATLPDKTGRMVHAYNLKYDNIDYNSAPTLTGIEKYALEPLQVFAVQAARGGTFKLTNDLKTTRDRVNTYERFPVSLKTQTELDAESAMVASTDATPVAKKQADAENTVTIPDWFVMEAVVLKDKKGAVEELSADRTAVRFFDTATESVDFNHDVTKNLNVKNKSNVTGADADDDDVNVLSPTNILYTSTPKGEALLANAVGYNIKSIPLHYLPGSETQDVSLNFYGIDGFENIDGVWLIDHFTGYKDRVYDGYEYLFKADPNESSVGSKNRFTLLFRDSDEDISLVENPITCYYSGSILHIGGLNEKDLGSKVYIYDLQGRLMGSTVINNYPGMEYQKSLGQGTFIVKIVGNRNFDTKFVNLQNY